MSLTALLSDYGIPYKTHGEHHHVTPGRVNVDCPRCSPGWRKWRLGIHLYKLHAHCWMCGFLPTIQALTEITGEAYGTLQALLGEPRLPVLEGRQRGFNTPPPGVGPLLRPHLLYLAKRGISEADANLWGLQGIGNAPRLSWRIFIPIHLDSRPVSWTTRSLVDTGLRYVSAKPEEEEVPHKELLYGEGLARHGIIICEGPLDAVRIGPGAVATLGVSYSQEQVARMARFPFKGVCFDQEPDAQRRARRLAQRLAVFPGETRVLELDAKDPGSADDEEINQIRGLLK